MRYSCVVVAVRDMGRARSFYEELFGLTVVHDYGRNLVFDCGLALQEDFDWLIGLPKERIVEEPNNIELCFEEAEFDLFLEKLAARPGVRYLGDVVEHDWGQRVMRFYDPDGHIIEVGEAMGQVVRRFLAQGMSEEEVALRMDIRPRDIEILLTE